MKKVQKNISFVIIWSLVNNFIFRKKSRYLLKRKLSVKKTIAVVKINKNVIIRSEKADGNNAYWLFQYLMGNATKQKKKT